MKVSILLVLIAFTTISPEVSGAGFFYKSNEVTNSVMGAKLFNAIKEANDNDSDLDVCYVGDYRDAINTTEKKTKSAIMFNVLDVYGEGQFPVLDTEVFNDKNDRAHGLFSHCFK